MAKRITIMLDDDLNVKIRTRQAQLIKKDTKTHSFSSVLNDILRKALIKKA